MKKTLLSIALSVLASASFVACQLEITPEVKRGEDLKELHFIVNTGETKTQVNNDGAGNYSTIWKKGDELGAFLSGTTINKDTDDVDMTLENKASDGATGSFEGTVVASGSGSFQAFYPASAFVKGYASGGIGLNIGATTDYIQHPSVGAPDPSCDILLSRACDYESDGSTVVIDDLFFMRPLSVLKINLKGTYAAGEEVSWLKFSVSSGTLSGRVDINLATSSINTWTAQKSYAWAEYSSSKPIINHATNNTVYLVVNPITLTGGTTITVTASTTNYDIEKAFTLSDEMTFPASKIAVLNLTIAESNCTPKAVPDNYGLIEQAGAFEDGGQYLFLLYDGATPSTYYALHTYRTLELNGLTPSDNIISDPNDKYIFIAEAGSEPGTFALKNKNTAKYWPAAAGTTTGSSSDPVDIELSYLSESGSYKIDLGDRFIAYYNTTEARFYNEAGFEDQIAAGKALTSQKSGAFKVFKLNYSPKVAFTTPTGLSVSGMVLSWDSVDGAASYNVSVGDTHVFGITETSYTFTGIAGYYDVSVVAVPSDTGSYSNSNPATLTEEKFGTPTILTPELVAGDINVSSVTVTWTDDPHATAGYLCEIYEGLTRLDAKTQNVSAGVQTVTFSDLTENTTYTIKINGKAVTGSKPYDASAVASIDMTPRGQHASDVTEAGEFYSIQGLTVVAVNGNNVIAADATGAVLIYKSGHGLATNDVINISGYVKAYNKVLEFYTDETHALTITKTGTTTAAYPSPVTYDASKITSYATTAVIEYATATGLANSSAKTITVAEGKVLNVYGSLASVDGRHVIVNGYAFGYYSSKVNFMLLGEPTIDESVPYLSTSPASSTTIEWDDDEYGDVNAQTITVTLNDSASGYSVAYSDSENAWTISDSGSGTITAYPKAANGSTTTDKTLSITITHGDDALLTSTITLQQNKQGGVVVPPASTVLFSESFDSAADGTSALVYYSSTGTTGAYNSATYGTITYTRSNNSNVQVENANSAGGSAKQIMINKNGGSLTISGIKTYGATSVRVSFKYICAKQSAPITATCGSTDSGNFDSTSADVASFDATVSGDTFDLVIRKTSTSNGTAARFDDITVTVLN